MRKISVLSIGFLLALFSLVVFFLAADIRGILCDPNGWSCLDSYNLIAIVSFFGPAFFVTSLFIFRLSDESFRKWKKFTLFFFLVYLVVVVLMPWSVGDAIAGFSKGTAGLVLSSLYLIVSVIYITFLSRKERIHSHLS